MVASDVIEKFFGGLAVPEDVINIWSGYFVMEYATYTGVLPSTDNIRGVVNAVLEQGFSANAPEIIAHLNKTREWLLPLGMDFNTAKQLLAFAQHSPNPTTYTTEDNLIRPAAFTPRPAVNPAIPVAPALPKNPLADFKIPTQITLAEDEIKSAREFKYRAVGMVFDTRYCDEDDTIKPKCKRRNKCKGHKIVKKIEVDFESETAPDFDEPVIVNWLASEALESFLDGLDEDYNEFEWEQDWPKIFLVGVISEDELMRRYAAPTLPGFDFSTSLTQPQLSTYALLPLLKRKPENQNWDKYKKRK